MRAMASKFLGFSFWVAAGRTIRRRVALQAIKRMKERVRELTRRSAGRSLAQMCKPLGTYLAGWKAYFRLADCKRRRILITADSGAASTGTEMACRRSDAARDVEKCASMTASYCDNSEARSAISLL